MCYNLCLLNSTKSSSEVDQKFYCNHVNITKKDNQFLNKYCNIEVPKRAKTPNDVNGYAKLGCVVFGVNSYCLLRKRYQQVQC